MTNDTQGKTQEFCAQAVQLQIIMVVFACNRYDYVEKDGECFHSLRAAGLAIELAHKLARSEGYGNVHAGALSHVSISGSRLRVYVGDRWRKVSRTSSVDGLFSSAKEGSSYSI